MQAEQGELVPNAAVDGRPKSQKPKQMQILSPVDPDCSPVHKMLFLGGLLFFPLWFYGAFRKANDSFEDMFKWRCQVMAMITLYIIAALLVLEIGFRNI